MSTPIFPRVIYPIGELSDGSYYAVVGTRGFDYLRDLPELDYDEDEITLVDNGPPTLRDEDVQSLIETERPVVPWWHRAA